MDHSRGNEEDYGDGADDEDELTELWIRWIKQGRPSSKEENYRACGRRRHVEDEPLLRAWSLWTQKDHAVESNRIDDGARLRSEENSFDSEEKDTSSILESEEVLSLCEDARAVREMWKKLFPERSAVPGYTSDALRKK